MDDIMNHLPYLNYNDYLYVSINNKIKNNIYKFYTNLIQA